MQTMKMLIRGIICAALSASLAFSLVPVQANLAPHDKKRLLREDAYERYGRQRLRKARIEIAAGTAMLRCMLCLRRDCAGGDIVNSRAP